MKKGPKLGMGEMFISLSSDSEVAIIYRHGPCFSFHPADEGDPDLVRFTSMGVGPFN